MYMFDSVSSFLYKQKTAYEMRISDWSSDVCSSDLLNTFCRAGHAPEMTMRFDARMFAFVPPSISGAVGNLPPVRRFVGMLLRDFRIPKSEIGSASCRERVCKLV